MTDNLSLNSEDSSIQGMSYSNIASNLGVKVPPFTSAENGSRRVSDLILGDGEEEGTCNAVALSRNGSDLSFDISSAENPDRDDDASEADDEEEIILNVRSNVVAEGDHLTPGTRERAALIGGVTRGLSTGLSFEDADCAKDLLGKLNLNDSGDFEAEKFDVVDHLKKDGDDLPKDVRELFSSPSSSLPNLKDESPTLETVAKWIKDGRCKRIVVLSGAGVSCSAGIPDFRTPGTGLYDNLEKYDLPYPEAVFDLSFYQVNPRPFVSLASELWPGLTYSPTLSHSFVALLASKNLLVRNYTQNIDGLETIAGVPEKLLVECHGHFRTASCISCGIPYDGKDCQKKMVEDKIAPDCPKCPKGIIKPDIVFFGESLPVRFGKCLHGDLAYADLILVMGTSLKVAPVSLIPEMVSTRCPRVLLNRELVGDFVPPGVEGNFRDVFVEADCDDSVVELCKLLGWEEELRELNSFSRIDV